MAGMTQKSCVTLFPLWSFKKTVVGYNDLKQQETYEKLNNRGWYNKWYWYFNTTTTTTNDKNNDDNTPASTVTATANH